MRWALGILLSIFGVLLLSQGMYLKAIGSSQLDSDVIEVSFLGMKINEKVYLADIPSYANGFLGTGMILLLLSVCLFFILLKEKSISKPISRKNHA